MRTRLNTDHQPAGTSAYWDDKRRVLTLDIRPGLLTGPAVARLARLGDGHYWNGLSKSQRRRPFWMECGAGSWQAHRLPAWEDPVQVAEAIWSDVAGNPDPVEALASVRWERLPDVSTFVRGMHAHFRTPEGVQIIRRSRPVQGPIYTREFLPDGGWRTYAECHRCGVVSEPLGRYRYCPSCGWSGNR